jgi:N-glycosylase/DNA lyase
MELRCLPYADAKAALTSLPGVGAKIADCVCLFSLGKHGAVPLDVHMTRVAKQLFSQARTMKTLTPKAYDEIADLFRQRFGEYSGWAQQYLFYNELLESGAWDKEMGLHVPATRRLIKQ